MYFACRHHTRELILRNVFETCWPVNVGPKVTIFERFKKTWINLNKEDYEIGWKDTEIATAISEKRRNFSI